MSGAAPGAMRASAMIDVWLGDIEESGDIGITLTGAQLEALHEKVEAIENLVRAQDGRDTIMADLRQRITEAEEAFFAMEKIVAFYKRLRNDGRVGYDGDGL